MTPTLQLSDVDVVVLCGGRGARLGGLTAQVPKPLLPAGDRPFLSHLLERLRAQGARRVILAAHYLAEAFVRFAEGLRDVEVLIEPEPLGTGGALRVACEAARTPTVVALNADSWLAQPIGPLLAAHAQRGAAMTLVAVRASRVEGGARNKGCLDIGPDGRLLGFATRPQADEGWVNGGLYALAREAVCAWPRARYDLESRLMALLDGRAAYVFKCEERLLDIGTPECYAMAQRTLDAGRGLEASANLRDVRV